jgi:bifunctional non-homologous end joining protein LigD
MLATAAALPADSTAYCIEPKWDGIRALARCGPRVELFSRNANHLQSFPDITEALSTVLAGREAILDGELVALDKRARPCFELIQRRLRATRPSAHLIAAVPALYVVFDVLHLDGADVTRRPYLQRRKLLESLRLDTAPLITSPSWTDISADVVLDVVRDMGLEGLIVKRAASTYQPGRRSAAWIKSVVRQRSPMIVGGWIAGGGRHAGGVGSLLLGAHNPVGELVYSGHVGTGLTDRARHTLAAALTGIGCPASPFIGPALVSTTGRVNWVTPLLVVDVQYREFTGRLRHPSLKGLAGDVDPATVTLPQTL